MNKKIYVATYLNLDVEEGTIDHSEVKVFDDPADAARWLDEDVKGILEEINEWEDEREKRGAVRTHVDSWHDEVRGYVNCGYSDTDLFRQHLWKVTEHDNPMYKVLDGLAARVCEWKDAMDKADGHESGDAVRTAFEAVRDAVRDVRGDGSAMA